MANASGLPFWDVMPRYDLAKPMRLGFATVHETQKRLKHDARWHAAGFK